MHLSHVTWQAGATAAVLAVAPELSAVVLPWLQLLHQAAKDHDCEGIILVAHGAFNVDVKTLFNGLARGGLEPLSVLKEYDVLGVIDSSCLSKLLSPSHKAALKMKAEELNKSVPGLKVGPNTNRVIYEVFASPHPVQEWHRASADAHATASWLRSRVGVSLLKGPLANCCMSLESVARLVDLKRAEALKGRESPP